MDIGKRIIFDQDGDIVIEFGEMSGDVIERKALSSLQVLDIEYGSIDYTKHQIVKVDPVTKEPILEEIIREKTDAERVIELENELLLMAEQNAGGIL